MRSRVVAGLLLVALAAVLSACGSSGSSTAATGTAASGAKKTIGIVFNTATEPDQQRAAAGIKEEAAKLGWTVKELDSNSDAAKANDLMQQLITQKVDAIVTIVWPSAALQGGIRAAQQANIPVYQFYAFGKPNGVAGLVSPTAAKPQTEQMVADMGGKGSVLAFTYPPGAPCADAEQTLDQVVAKSPGVKVQKQQVPAPGWAQTAATTTSAWLKAHPNGSGALAVWGCWDGPNVGAASALRQAGRTDVKVYGSGGESDALSLLQKGQYTTTYWFDLKQGGVDLAKMIAAGAGVGGKAPQYLILPSTKLDKTDIAQFLQQHPQSVQGG
jgi:ribose transport system substrate-binding protein